MRRGTIIANFDDMRHGRMRGATHHKMRATLGVARPCSSEGALELREANRLLSASRWATRSKVSAVTIAGTGISVHSARGRSTVFDARGVERPCSRATRFSPGDSCTTIVLPNTARPVKAGLRSIPSPSGPTGACRCGSGRPAR